MNKVWWTQGLFMARNLSHRIPRPFCSPILPSSHVRFNLRLLQPAIRFSSSQPPNDPVSRLFYHRVELPTSISMSFPACALSFSPEIPPLSSSKTIIGWVPTQEGAACSASSPPSRSTLNPNDFVPNREPKFCRYRLLVDISLAAFVEVLHSAIKDGLTEGIDETQKAMAVQTNHGWMHIHGMSNF